MTSALDSSGRSVLVVGGSSGIGNGIAQAFRAQGATIEALDVLVLAQRTVLYQRREIRVEGFYHVLNVNLNS